MCHVAACCRGPTPSLGAPHQGTRSACPQASSDLPVTSWGPSPCALQRGADLQDGTSSPGLDGVVSL